jgi:hypothetical protein
MLNRAKLEQAVKQVLLDYESDFKWAHAYGDFDEVYKDVSEKIVEVVLEAQIS